MHHTRVVPHASRPSTACRRRHVSHPTPYLCGQAPSWSCFLDRDRGDASVKRTVPTSPMSSCFRATTSASIGETLARRASLLRGIISTCALTSHPRPCPHRTYCLAYGADHRNVNLCGDSRRLSKFASAGDHGLPAPPVCPTITAFYCASDCSDGVTGGRGQGQGFLP